MIQVLPIELQTQILSYCDFKTVMQCSKTCKSLYQVSFQDEVWFHLTLDLFIKDNNLLFSDHYNHEKRRIFSSNQIWLQRYKLIKELYRNWSRATSPMSFTLDSHSDSVYCCQSDRKKIVTGSRDQTVRIWDWATLDFKVLKGHRASVLCLHYDDEIMVTGSSDMTMVVWDMKTFTILHEIRGHIAPVLDVKINKKIIASCAKDNTIKIWDRNTRQLLRNLIGHTAAVNAICLHGNTIASASGDGTIRLWDIDNGALIKQFTGHSRGLACIQYNGDIIVSGSNDRTIKVWDVASGECLKTLEGHTDLVRTLSLSNRYIVSGSYDFTIKLWDLKTGKMLLDIPRSHSSWVFHVIIEFDRIISTSQDHTITEWRFLDKRKADILEPVFEMFKF